MGIKCSCGGVIQHSESDTPYGTVKRAYACGLCAWRVDIFMSYGHGSGADFGNAELAKRADWMVIKALEPSDVSYEAVR